LTYIAFHTDDTGYLAHELRQTPESEKANPPDFYQILSSKFKLEANAGEALRIRFPKIANTVQNRLTPNSKASGLADGGQKVKVQTYSELIFDPNHLK
jgi:hypothetical protein